MDLADRDNFAFYFTNYLLLSVVKQKVVLHAFQYSWHEAEHNASQMVDNSSWIAID